MRLFCYINIADATRFTYQQTNISALVLICFKCYVIQEKRRWHLTFLHPLQRTRKIFLNALRRELILTSTTKSRWNVPETTLRRISFEGLLVVSWKSRILLLACHNSGHLFKRSTGSNRIVSTCKAFVTGTRLIIWSLLIMWSLLIIWSLLIMWSLLPLKRSSRFQRLFPNPSWLVWGRASRHQKLAPTFPGIDSCLMVTKRDFLEMEASLWLNGKSQNVAKGWLST